MAILTNDDYNKAMGEIELLLKKGVNNLTEGEGERLDDLSSAVELWEKTNHPMPLKEPDQL